MRIAVIGTGKIGGTLGGAFARAGHEVAFGSRHPEDADDAAVVGVAEALSGADVVLLALPGGAVEGFLAEYGGQLDDTILIDAANRMGGAVTHSAAAVAAAAPRAHYVRAFNTLGWENFAQPTFDGVAADLFFAAPEADRATIEGLIADVGLRPAYLGEGKQDLVDTLLPLWFTLAQARGQRHLAFRILSD